MSEMALEHFKLQVCSIGLTNFYPCEKSFNIFLQQECIPVGCEPPAYCPCLRACTAPVGVPAGGGVPGHGGVPAQGVYLPREDIPAQGVYLPGECTCPGTPPCGQRDTCKNISFANFVCER